MINYDTYKEIQKMIKAGVKFFYDTEKTFEIKSFFTIMKKFDEYTKMI